MNARLGAIRRKRDALIASGRGREHFGKYWDEWRAHEAKWGPRTEAEITTIERAHGIVLPDEYRAFVIGVADGGLAPGCGMFALEEAIADAPEWTGALSAPFPYGNADAHAVLTKRAQGERHASLDQPNDDGLPGGCLLLSHTGSGCFDVLVLTGEQRGTIWFHDTQRLFPIASSGRQLGFFDWMEGWLDGWASAAPPPKR